MQELKGGPVPKDLQNEYEAAKRKTGNAATRMKEIEWEMIPESRWHAQLGWKAEDYFHDQKVLALCRAIEANDVAEMERRLLPEPMQTPWALAA